MEGYKNTTRAQNTERRVGATKRSVTVCSETCNHDRKLYVRRLLECINGVTRRSPGDRVPTNFPVHPPLPGSRKHTFFRPKNGCGRNTKV